LILDVLREATEPLRGCEIATLVMDKLGTPEDARMAIDTRVRANLTYLKGPRGLVSKCGEHKDARWTLNTTEPTS
jgi:hypothetical protein